MQFLDDCVHEIELGYIWGAPWTTLSRIPCFQQLTLSFSFRVRQTGAGFESTTGVGKHKETGVALRKLGSAPHNRRKLT
jgi:hypothetical protein